MESACLRMEELRIDAKHLGVQFHGKALGQFTLSMGIAVFPEHGATGEILLKAADEALYRAKHSGRDRVNTA